MKNTSSARDYRDIVKQVDITEVDTLFLQTIELEPS